MRKAARAGTKRGEGLEADVAGDDLLRILLKKWAEKVEGAKDAEFENIWEKRSQKIGPEIAVQSSEEASALGPGRASDPAETGVIG